MILTAVTFLPVAGAVAIAFVPRTSETLVKQLALLTAVIAFLASLPLYTRFDARSPDYQFVETAQWMPSFGIGYHLGVAGIMGAMWLWERRTSRVREQQIDEAHARIMADRVMLDQLMEVVQRNTEALARLATRCSSLLPPGEG